MTITLTTLVVISWLLLFVGLFLYDRLDRRVARLTVVQEHILRTQQAILQQLGGHLGESQLDAQLGALLEQGKTYEAMMVYRAARGTGDKEARAYIDALK